MSYQRTKSASLGAPATGGTPSYKLINSDFSANGGAVTTGISELVAGSGIYGALVTFPSGFRGWLAWTVVVGPNTFYAAFPINPESDEYLDSAISGVPPAVWSYTTAFRDQDGLTTGITAWDCVTTARQSVVGGFTLNADRSVIQYMPDGVSTMYTVTPADAYDIWDTDLVARTFTATQAGAYLQNLLGYKLARDGLDSVVVETDSTVSINARQALAIHGAALAGTVFGMGTGNVVCNAMGLQAPTPRITAVTDANGDRSSVVLTPPA